MILKAKSESRKAAFAFLRLCCRECRRRAAKIREAEKGFNWIRENVLFGCADSRFAEPRIFLTKVLIVAVRSCRCGALIQGLRNLEVSLKGFNCCGAKLRQRCADSRFAKPRSFLRKERFSCFLRRAKRTKKHARGLRASGLRGRFKALPKIFLIKFPSAHVETGFSHKTAAKRL